MIDVEVIATDGLKQKRIIGISTSNNGIYYYYLSNDGRDLHYSYHTDGSVWDTYNGSTKKISQFQPLTSFQNKAQIVSFGFSKDIDKLKTKDYELKKLNSVVYVDVRSFKSKTHIGCNITLLEPKNMIYLWGLNISVKKFIFILKTHRG